MGYYSRVELDWVGDNRAPLDEAQARMAFDEFAQQFDPDQTYDHAIWREEFGRLIGPDPEAVNIKNLTKEWATELVIFLSLKFPDLAFGIRGVGENFDDMWRAWGYRGQVHSDCPLHPPAPAA